MSMLSRFSSLAAPSAKIQYVGGYATSVTPASTDRTITFGGNLTGGLASSASAGDLVVVYFGVGDTSEENLIISSYSQIADLYANDTSDASLVVGYKIMGATPDTTVTLTGGTGGTAGGGAIAIQVWRGVDQNLPIDVPTTTATGTNSVLCNPPSITSLSSGSVIVAGGVGAHTAGVQTFSSSNLSGFITSGSTDTNTDATIGLGYTTSVGAFDPAAFTFSAADSTSYSWAAVTIALRPAGNSNIGPFLVNYDFAATAAGTTVAFTRPTGITTGDLLVSFVAAAGTVTWTVPSGWTEVLDQGTGASLGVAYKVATSSEPSTYTFTSSVADDLSGILTVYRNAAYDTVGSVTSASASTSFSVGAVTAAADYSRILAITARTAASIVITANAPLYEIYKDDGATGPSYSYAQDSILSPAGSSGSRSFTVPATAGTYNGVLTAIKPAASYTPYVTVTDFKSNNTLGSASTITFTSFNNIPGSLLIFVATAADFTAGAITATTPSGWTLLSAAPSSGTAYEPAQYVFYRVSDGTETDVSTTWSDIYRNCCALIAIAGADVSTLTAGTTNTGSNTTSVTATGVNAATNGLLLWCASQANSNAGVAFTRPTGMTEIVDINNGGGSPFTALSIARQEGLTAGATGDKTGTASSAAGTDYYRAILVTVGPKSAT